MATIRNLLLRLGIDVDPLDRGFKRAATSVEKFDKHFSRLAKAGAITAGIGSLAGAATSLSAALAPAAGAIVALPAAMGVAKVASGTLKIGIMGVGDAMKAVAEGDAKKLEKAMAVLSPNARAFVNASKGFAGALSPIRTAVQDKLFDGLAGGLKGIASNLLPSVKTGMVGVAGAFNVGAKEAIKFAGTPMAKGVVNTVFAATTRILTNMGTAVRPALEAISRLVVLGLPLTERMAGWAVNGVKAASAFLKSKEGAEKLSGWASRAGDTLAQLGRIGKSALNGLIAIFGNVKFTGDGVLDTIEKMTAKFETWAKSAKGADQVRGMFQLFMEILRQVVAVLPLFLGPIGAVLKIMSGLPAPIQTVVAKFAAFSLVAFAVAGKLSGIVSAVGGVTKGVFVATTAVVKFSSGLAQGASALGANAGSAAKAGAAIRTFGGNLATAAVSGWDTFRLKGMYAKDALVKFGGTITTGISTVSSFAVNTGKAALENLKLGVQLGIARAQTIAATVAQAAANVASKAWAIGIRLVNAAMKANPIGIVITIIAALIAIIVLAYNKNETFRKIVQAVWAAIQKAISYAWNNVIKPALQALWSFITNTLAPKIMWFHNSIVSPIFKKIGQVITAVWTSGIRPTFTALATFITKTVPNAFQTGVTAIGKFWDKVKAIAKSPVTFMVNTIYNNGIRKIWNWVASKVGMGILPEITGFATGGRINKGTTGTADDVLIKASRGEFMVNAASTKRNSGLIDYVNRFGKNKDILKESGFAGDPGGMGIPGYAEGGIIGWVSSFIKKGKDFFMNGFYKAAQAALNPIVNLAKSGMGGTGFGSMLANGVNTIVDGVLAKFKPLESKLGGGGGGKVVQAARSQIGVPYSWGGGGPGGPSYGIGRGAGTKGFDCSGLTEYAWYKAIGKSIGGTTYSQKATLQRISGPRPGAVGQPNPGHTYIATEKGGIIEAPFTGGFVREMPMRSTPYWGWPKGVGSVMDAGGSLTPGWNPPIWNGTGKREGVFTPDMVSAMAGGGGSTYNITANVSPGTSPAEVGRQIVSAIKSYEKTNGTRWRGNP